MFAIVEYLDGPTLKAFGLMNHTYNTLAKRRLWRSITITTRSPTVMEWCNTILRDPTRASIKELCISNPMYIPTYDEDSHPNNRWTVIILEVLQALPSLRSLRLDLKSPAFIETIFSLDLPFRLTLLAISERYRHSSQPPPDLVPFLRSQSDIQTLACELHVPPETNLPLTYIWSAQPTTDLVRNRPVSTLDMADIYNYIIAADLQSDADSIGRVAAASAAPIRVVRLSPPGDIGPILQHLAPHFPHLHSLGLYAVRALSFHSIIRIVRFLSMYPQLEEFEFWLETRGYQVSAEAATRWEFVKLVTRKCVQLKRITFTFQCQAAAHFFDTDVYERQGHVDGASSGEGSSDEEEDMRPVSWTLRRGHRRWSRGVFHYPSRSTWGIAAEDY